MADQAPLSYVFYIAATPEKVEDAKDLQATLIRAPMRRLGNINVNRPPA
jgi:hypothetical protein